MLRLPILALALAATAASAFAASPLLSVREEMKQTVEPASNTLFAVGGEVDPANGPDQPKTADAHWQEALQAARAVKGVAGDLQLPALAKAGDWTTFAQQMAVQADAAAKAAAAHDGAGLSTAANALADTCSGCHAKYKPQSAG